MVKGAPGGGAAALLSTLCDDEAAAFERGLEAHGGGLIGNIEFLELLAVDGREAGEEGLVLRRGKLGLRCDQYSCVLKASISASRSQTRRSATDCTRPAERAPGSFRHSTGDRVKPTR